MSQTLVHVRGSRQEVINVLRQLPRVAAGKDAAIAAGLEKVLLVRMALALLGRIKDAFVVKSRGGTDESGLRWASLQPGTVARRRHPGIRRKRDHSNRPSAILTPTQRKRWWAIYRNALARYRGDKAHAAAVAWVALKSEGAPTILGVYGGTSVDILRDKGFLLNSLSPGVSPDMATSAPPPKKDQVFRLGAGHVIVGTSRKGASRHHKGIPRRRLWPDPDDWPVSWWQDILEQGRAGLIDIALHLLGKK